MGCYYSTFVSIVHNNESESELKLLNKDNKVIKGRLLKLNNSRNKVKANQTQPVQTMRHFQTNSNLKDFKNAIKRSSAFDNVQKYDDLSYSNKILKRLSLKKFNELFDENNFEYYKNKTTKRTCKQISYISRANNLYNYNSLSLSLNSTVEHTLENKVENIRRISPIKNVKKKLKEKISFK
jgi:hypothetical protein